VAQEQREAFLDNVSGGQRAHGASRQAQMGSRFIDHPFRVPALVGEHRNRRERKPSREEKAPGKRPVVSSKTSKTKEDPQVVSLQRVDVLKTPSHALASEDSLSSHQHCSGRPSIHRRTACQIAHLRRDRLRSCQPKPGVPRSENGTCFPACRRAGKNRPEA
jgi:hypothetical protein